MAKSQQIFGSEAQCAQRMKGILDKKTQLENKLNFFVHEVASRYGVHIDTAYKGIRSGDPLYPLSHALGAGARPRIAIAREQIIACDKRRIEFYKNTPSWCKNDEDFDGTFPIRISAREMFPKK